MSENNTTAEYNCFNDPPELKAYGDISGSGVLAGFLGTAYLVVLIIGVYYLFAYDPGKNPFKGVGDDANADSTSDAASSRSGSSGAGIDAPSASWRLNPIDHHILRFLRAGVGKITDRRLKATVRHKLDKAFSKCIIGFCDAQILTGIGILVSAYGSLPADLSAYHWRLVVYLAWFANLTHLSTLTFLRNYLQRHRRERNWRVLSMVVLLVLLVTAEVPTAFFNWPNAGDVNWEYTVLLPTLPEPTAATPASIARCFFNMTLGRQRYDDANVCWTHDPKENIMCDVALSETTAFQSMLLSVLLLVFNFVTRVVKLSRRLSAVVHERIRDRLSRWLKNMIHRCHRHPLAAKGPLSAVFLGKLKLYFFTKPQLALLLMLRLYADLYASMLSEVFWLFVSAVWGSIHLFNARNSADVDEAKLTFGQILPIFLLAVPLVPVVVAVLPTWRQLRRSTTWFHQPADGLMAIREAAQRRDLEHQLAVSPNEQQREPGDASDGQAVAAGASTETNGQDAHAADEEPEWLNRDYYTAPWMLPTAILAMLQILILTVDIFILLSNKISAAKTFVSLLVWFFVTQPSAAYLVILFGLAAEGHTLPIFLKRRQASRLGRTRLTFNPHSFFWLLVALVIFVSCSLIPIGSNVLFAPSRPQALMVNFITLLVLVGLACLYFTVCLLLIGLEAGRRRRRAIDDGIELQENDAVVGVDEAAAEGTEGAPRVC